MLGALALAATIYASSGTTYSSIAAQYGVSVSAVEADNSYPATDIPVGAVINIPGGGSSVSGSSPSSSSSTGSPSSSGGSTSSGSTGSSSGYHIPGVSDATTACIAFKESTNGQGSPNVFQISNYYPGESLAQQEAAAGQIAATQGVHNAWGVYDGCA